MCIRVGNSDHKILLTAILNRVVPARDDRKSVHIEVVQTADVRRCRRSATGLEILDDFCIHFGHGIEALITGPSAKLVKVIHHTAIGRAEASRSGISCIGVVNKNAGRGAPLCGSIGDRGI